MIKPVLMIHQITEAMFKLPLEDYTLTFDDGTIDHYEYYSFFNNLNTEKIYFIATNNIGKEGYMSISHIKEMLTCPLTSFGGHSHIHKRLDGLSLFESTTHINHDTSNMINWFVDNLGFKPTKFCYPFNNDLKGIYTGMLKKHGITEFYGSERIPIEKLLHTENQIENL